jgi:hypothetical protein
MRRKEAGYSSLHNPSVIPSRLTRELAQKTKDRASICHTHGKLGCEDPKCNPSAYSTDKDPMFKEVPLDELYE